MGQKFKCQVCGALYEYLMDNGYGDFQCGFCLNCFGQEPVGEAMIKARQADYIKSGLFELNQINEHFAMAC